MAAISIRDPWARAVFYLGKNVENRTWYTRYRGLLLIHVPLRADHDDVVEKELVGHPRHLGAIIGVVKLVHCGMGYRSKWAEAGFYHWVFEKPTPLAAPLPYKGQLGLFPVAHSALGKMLRGVL